MGTAMVIVSNNEQSRNCLNNPVLPAKNGNA